MFEASRDVPLEVAATDKGFQFRSGLGVVGDHLREYAYDRNSRIGKLDKGLDEARAKSWPVISDRLRITPTPFHTDEQ